jgi:hypothetical protein
MEAEEVGRRETKTVKEEGAEEVMEKFRVANADRAEGISMVGFCQSGKLGLLGLSSELPVLSGHFEADLYRRRAGV